MDQVLGITLEIQVIAICEFIFGPKILVYLIGGYSKWSIIVKHMKEIFDSLNTILNWAFF